MISKITEINFPKYATLSQATVTINDMGERTITARVAIDGSVVPDFSFDWAVEFKGERYIQPLRQPQAGKNDSSASSFVDLTFYHWAVWQMKRYYFVEMTSTESGTAIADQYIASLGLNLPDFCTAFSKVLRHYFGDTIKIDLNPQHGVSLEPQYMNISYSYIWDVLQKVYEVYGVRWDLVTNEDGSCSIRVGYPPTILSHTFQYGYEGGLLSIERQVQDANIRNSLLGRGGEQNLPAYYFKEAPEGSLFASDPDAIPELANIYFSNLRGKTFRDYIKGWKAKHYGGEPMSKPTEAYTKGYTDTKFNPVEYVNDNASIDKYGLLQGALDNNEDIYPSIKGAPNGGDVVVYVEPVTSDDVEQSVGKAETIAIDVLPQSRYIGKSGEGKRYTVTLNSADFDVPEDNYALNIGFNVSYDFVANGEVVHEGATITHFAYEHVYNRNTGKEVDKSSLSKGTYYVSSNYTVEIPYSNFWDDNKDNTTLMAIVGSWLNTSLNLQLRRLQNGATDKWLPTFNIWVKNIWNSTRKSGESDEAYAERVWRPILGDRQGNEAKVVFSSGWLSGHEDYEFTIVDFAYDNSRKYDGSQSEWRLTLAKSDAELDATGKYIPSASTNGQAHAGDTFFFIGIDMPYQYVLWAEERLDNYKTAALNEVSEIQPKWVVRFDKLRLHEEDDNLAEQITVGGAINLADVRFIDAPALQLYLQSVTYTWNEQTTLYPDIEVVLADTIVPVQSPVAQLQGSIDAINSQLYNIGNVAQTVRKIGDSLYLRKDGVEDTSKSPTKFVGNVSGHNFRMGKVGGADWGIYRDEHGNAIAEFDKIIARKDLEVNNLVINQVSYVGGKQITSAASLTITRVIESDAGYQCFFDQKGGSVANLFAVNDIAYSQRFDQENNATKYYKRVVAEVGLDYITLSKTNVDGDGEPMANDVVIHYGNTTDTNRQYVIIKDIIGGGYERMLSSLNSVSATGVEYYFAGRTNGNTPRWFVGDKSQQYIEYKDGHLRIIADVTLGENSVLPDSLNVDYLKQAFPQGSVLLNVNGVTLSALIGVKGENDKIVAGLYGGASPELNSKGYADDTHGAMLLFGGIDGADKPTTYKTAIFEDGYIESEYFATARTGARVEMFDNQVKIFGSDGSTHILMGWSAETGNPELQYVDANGARPWLITSQGISNAVTINTEQKISVVKDFDKGLKIGGLHAYRSQDDTIYLDANLVVRGGVTAFGTNKTITASLFEALPIDGKTIKRNPETNELYVDTSVIGSGGIDETQLEAYLTANAYATQSWVLSQKYLTGISSSMVTDALGYTPYNSANFTKANIKSTLGINDWALENVKPNYTAKEVGAVTESATIHSASLNDFTTAGIYRFNTPLDATEGMTNYGNLFVIRGGYNDTFTQLYFNYDGDGRIFSRSGDIINYPGRSWKTLAFTSDIPVKLSQLTDDVVSGKYLPITGGTLDGNLLFTAAGAGRKFGIYKDGSIRFNTTSRGGWATGLFVSNNDGSTQLGTIAGAFGIGDNLSYHYYGGTYEAPKMAILPTGNVSIGGTTADAKLHIHGTVRAEGVLHTTNWINDTGQIVAACGGTSYKIGIGATSGGYATVQGGQSGVGAIPLLLNPSGGNVVIGGITASEKLQVYGNILATGGLTAQNSSDERLKRNIRKFSASKVLMSLGGVFEYEYVDSEVQKNHIYEGTHYGLIYQHVKDTKLDIMCHEREDGMGALNYLHPKFISLIAGATMENISEVEKLKREIRHLKAKVKQLERGEV